MDCGLILTKSGVSLEKEPGRTGILGSRPLDLELVAQDVTIHVLILAAGNRSDGSGAMGARGGAGSPEIQVPRRRFTGNSSELVKLAFQGSIRSRFGSGRIYASCVIHPWH